MKTTIKFSILALLFIMITTESKAQLKVRSNGNVGVGAMNPFVKFEVEGNGALFYSQWNQTSCAYIRGNNNYSSASNPDYTFWYNDLLGIYHPSHDVMGFCSGGFTLMELKHPSNQWELILYGSGLASGGIWQSSDRRMKNNINPLDKSLEKVMKLKGVSFNYRLEEFKKCNFPDGKQIGFIAQEVQEVFPELVKPGNEDYLAVNYEAIIPVLVEAIKEQQAQIEALKTSIINSGGVVESKQSGSSLNPSDTRSSLNVEVPLLYQNVPNPFGIESTIKFFIPSFANQVALYVYDINGNKKKSFIITERGEGTVRIAANELGKGAYFYSLVIDGSVTDSKSMLITD